MVSWTAIYRDLGDTGIVTCGIAILTEVSRVSHNTNRKTDVRDGSPPSNANAGSNAGQRLPLGQAFR